MLQMQKWDYATPTNWKRMRGGFKYSTKKTLARSRMGKRLKRVLKVEGLVFFNNIC